MQAAVFSEIIVPSRARTYTPLCAHESARIRAGCRVTRARIRSCKRTHIRTHTRITYVLRAAEKYAHSFAHTHTHTHTLVLVVLVVRHRRHQSLNATASADIFRRKHTHVRSYARTLLIRYRATPKRPLGVLYTAPFPQSFSPTLEACDSEARAKFET